MSSYFFLYSSNMGIMTSSLGPWDLAPMMSLYNINFIHNRATAHALIRR